LRSPLLAGLVFFAAPALAAAADNGPIVKDGVEITVVSQVASAGEPAGVVEATLDVEARTDAAALKLGFQSMRAVTAVDCAKGVNRFIKADAYAQSDLKGPANARLVSGDWVKPSDDSFMFGVTRRICSGSPGTPPPPPRPNPPPGPLPVVTMGTQPTHTPPPPPPAPPQRSVAAIATKPAASAPPAAAFRTSATGRGVAQVAASPTAQAAQQVLERLQGMIAPPLVGSVEAATVQNAHIFRASVTGFVSLGDAQAFCARVASVSKTCWVHWKAGTPAKSGHP
jgi:hypothetical protein